MKKNYLSVFILVIAFFLNAPTAEAQKIQKVFGNVGFGAANGAALGAATMALDNKSNWNMVTFGIGAGILAGAGVGAYDIVNHPDASTVSGLFNTVPLTGGIILLDTMYGAGSGALIGMAFSLMGAGDFGDALRVGAGVGAWAGFAFGLVDAFYFASQSHGDDAFFDYGHLPGTNHNSPAAGFISLHQSDSHSVALLNPVYIEHIQPGYEVRGMGVELMRWHFNF